MRRGDVEVYNLILVIVVIMAAGMLFKSSATRQVEFFSFFVTDESVVQMSSIAAVDVVYLQDAFDKSVELAEAKISAGAPSNKFCCYANTYMNLAIKGRGMENLMNCVPVSGAQSKCLYTTGKGVTVSGTTANYCDGTVTCTYEAYDRAAILQDIKLYSGTTLAPACPYTECDTDGDGCLDKNEDYADYDDDYVPSIIDSCPKGTCMGGGYFCNETTCRPQSCGQSEKKSPDCSGSIPTCVDQCGITSMPGGADNDGDGFHIQGNLDSDKDCFDLDCGADTNRDGIVDICLNGDRDGDGIIDGVDTDVDGDNVFNDYDNCPYTSNADQLDTDSDGRGNVCDNCPAVANADQADADADGVGDACEV
ncbi:MAG: thrombospondin type 3 repeat-containing protein [archaeon]